MVFFILQGLVSGQTFKTYDFNLEFFDGYYHSIVNSDTTKIDTTFIMIKYIDDISNEEISSLEETYNLALDYVDQFGYYTYQMPRDSLYLPLAQKINDDTFVQYFQMNFELKNFAIPNDEFFSEQWYLETINAIHAWNIETGKSDVKIAVIGTGVYWDHEDLGPGQDGYENIYHNPGEDEWQIWNDPTSGDGCDGICGTTINDPNEWVDDWKGIKFNKYLVGFNDSRPFTGTPYEDHETMVAGIIAAKTNNSVGIAGIAGGNNNNGCSIIPIKLDDDGYWFFKFKKALDYAINGLEPRADIIQLSMGSQFASDASIDALLLDYYNTGGLTIASAGNTTPDANWVAWPAIRPWVISVTASDHYDFLAPFAVGYHPSEPEPLQIEIAAPGIDIYSTSSVTNGVSTYGMGSGSSFSSPMVSATAGLIWSVNPTLTNFEVREILQSTADKVHDYLYDYQWDLNYPGLSYEMGFGRLNTCKAVFEAASLLPETTITVSTTWDEPVVSVSGFVIEENVSLRITSSVYMGRDAKIIVEPGATLILDGGTLTNYKYCGYEGEMWQGVEVWGKSDKSQHIHPYDNIQWQGKIVLKDIAVIENAITAVKLYKEGSSEFNGGIIIANNAVFRNNAKAVHFMEYNNFNPVTLEPADNISYFKYCDFEITQEYLGGETFFKHADLASVRGIKFTACNFSTIPPGNGVYMYNHAIGSYSSGFSAMAVCSQNNVIPCPGYDKCTFTGFFAGVYATNIWQNNNTFYINRADFHNNVYGVLALRVNNATVLNSNFYIGYNEPESDPCDSEGKAASSYGIHMTGCTGFAIEENYFTKASGAPQGNYTGILCKDSKSFHDIIYRNTFSGLSYGNFAEGDNRSSSHDLRGLEYQCNTNTANNRDFIVTSDDPLINARIRGYQGSMSREAGNTFSTGVQLPDGHFKNTGTQVINYCYNTNPPVYYTPFYVMPIPNAGINTCPSNYGGGSGGSTKDVVLTEDEKQEAELAFANNLSDFNNVKALFDNLKDGGNTLALKTEVETAWPSDMWALRDELLGKSPHLSQEVLIAAADKTDVLPESILFEILSANPDELRKEELISHLENKDQPLPAYMISILRQLAGGVTYKTILQQDMARYFAGKTQAAYMLIRSCLNDTVSNYAYLRAWLNNLDNLNADRQIVASYLAEENYTSAQAMLNLIPATRNLEGNALADYNDYKTMMEMQMAWQQQNRSIFELDSLEIAILLDFAENTNGKAALMARGMLEYAYGYHFCNCLPVDDPAAWKSTALMPGSDVDNGISIQVVPNPASTWVAFNYTLPVHVNEAVLQITDVHGRSITSFVLTANHGQQIWDIRDVKKGVYLYTLKAGTMSKNGKLIIN